jgi:hypothetical protein
MQRQLPMTNKTAQIFIALHFYFKIKNRDNTPAHTPQIARYPQLSAGNALVA